MMVLFTLILFYDNQCTQVEYEQHMQTPSTCIMPNGKIFYWRKEFMTLTVLMPDKNGENDLEHRK